MIYVAPDAFVRGCAQRSDVVSAAKTLQRRADTLLTRSFASEGGRKRPPLVSCYFAKVRTITRSVSSFLDGGTFRSTPSGF